MQLKTLVLKSTKFYIIQRFNEKLLRVVEFSRDAQTSDGVEVTPVFGSPGWRISGSFWSSATNSAALKQASGAQEPGFFGFLKTNWAAIDARIDVQAAT